MNKIYLNEYIHPDAVAYLKERAEIIQSLDHPEELDAIIIRGGKVGRELMERAPRLKVIGRHGVGYESIDIAAAKELGIHVVTSPAGNVRSVAEQMVGLFIAMSRDFYRANQMVRRGEIQHIAPIELQGHDISEKTLGLVGMGNINRIVAEMMQAAFHVQLIGYDPYVSEERATALGIKKIEKLEDLLENSDLVSLCVPLTQETRNMISGSMFDHFRPNAVLVNEARGGVVNEDDLYTALKTGKLHAAAFDVFSTDPGPLPTDCPLLELENFSATPHIGGNTEEALYRVGMTLVKNVLAVLEGGTPTSLIV